MCIAIYLELQKTCQSCGEVSQLKDFVDQRPVKDNVLFLKLYPAVTWYIQKV